MTRALTRRVPEVLPARMRPWRPANQLLDVFRAMFAPVVQQQPQFLTVKQAAEYTGLSEGFVMRLIQLRKLPALSDQGYKVRRADLDRMSALSATTKKLAAVTREMRQVVTARRGR